MNDKVKVDLSLAKELLQEKDIKQLLPYLSHAQKNIIERSGLGNEFLGWVDLPERMRNDKTFFNDLQEIKNEIKINNVDTLVVI